MLVTRCCQCQHPMSIAASIAMLMGMNTGHVTCPKCHAFLHVEVLEGNEAWTELWNDYVERTGRGPSIIHQRSPPFEIAKARHA